MHIKTVLISSSVIAVVLFLGVISVAFLYASGPGYLDFWIQGVRYSQIIKAVKAIPIPPGTTRSLRVDPDLNPASLRTLESAATTQSSVGVLHVERDSSGDYMIELITVDHRHAGFAGYLYLDKERNGTPSLQPMREPSHRLKKISKNWYSFYNYET